MRILLVGDTHGNTPWWVDVVEPAARMLDVDAVCQLGDFGFWPDAQDFIDRTASSPVPVYFLDGNHEHHPWLDHIVDDQRSRQPHLTPTDPVHLDGNLHYLPRGGRITWDGVTVVAVGGARSIDRALRTPGIDWFFEEALDNDDINHICEGGAAQVMLCHDAPAVAPVPLAEDWCLPPIWQRERPACHEHRLRLDETLDVIQPAVVVHGHYHTRWEGTITRPWGSCHVVGLAEDGTSVQANMAILHCDTGTARLVAVHSR